jgi:putative nucleotidyltransferase with HDIG domain
VLVVSQDHSPNGRWGILVLALLAQFACDIAAGAARVRLEGELTMGELVRELGPVYAVDAALALIGLAAALAAYAVRSQFVVLLIVPLFLILRSFSRERHERLEQMAELNDAYQGTALLLGDVVEADDAYTGEHCRSVVRLALDVARQLDLDADSVRNVEFAALLHDIGKIAIPNEIINKRGALDEREWEIIKTHTLEGQRMLERIGGFMREIGRIVRASHERWDGGGYPDGLRGQEIPIEARIVCACDAFNAMTTTRSYRSAMSVSEATAELERCAGSQFDPRVAECLLRVVARTLELSPEHETPEADRVERETVSQPDDRLLDEHAHILAGVAAPVERPNPTSPRPPRRRRVAVRNR